MEVQIHKSDGYYISLEASNDLRHYRNTILLTISEALSLLDSDELKIAISSALLAEEPSIKLHKKNVTLAKKLGIM